MSKDKPDNVADNPGLLPYASNVGAPAIKPDDVATWKSEKVVKTNHYFETRYNEIKEEYRKLIESYEWNKLVYESEFIDQTSLAIDFGINSTTILTPGKKYIYRVRAVDGEEKDIYRNNGYSEWCWFFYGYPSGGHVSTTAFCAKKRYEFSTKES